MWEPCQQHFPTATAPKQAGTAPTGTGPPPLTLCRPGPTTAARVPQEVCCKDKQNAGFLSSPCSFLLAGRKESRRAEDNMDSSQVGSLHWPRKSSSACSLIHKATSSLSHRKLHIPAKGTVGHGAPLSLLPIPFQLFERGADPSLLPLLPCSPTLFL